jgi:hypothetical protein
MNRASATTSPVAIADTTLRFGQSGSLAGAPQVRDGIEPPTLAFSGPPSNETKWSGISGYRWDD